jgi:hypothetical protein
VILLPDPNIEGRKHARERAKKARKDGSLSKFEYMDEKGRFGVSKVSCKCGHTLQQLRAIPEMSETEVIKGQTIIRERIAMFTNASYTEIVITFDDGSKHVSPVCGDCILRGFTENVLNDIYACDMDRWDKEEVRGMGKVNWHLLAYRVAVSWKEVPAEERFSD